MAKGKDYYALLGVKKDCTEAELKSAYKKAALKHHPDRGGDEAKFKDVSEAYEALSDPQKRTIYDQFGEEGLKAGGGMPPGAGASGGNPFAGFGGGGAPGGFPGGTTFSFSSNGPGGGSPFGGGFPGGKGGFVPSDPNDLFSSIFANLGGMGGMGAGARGSPFGGGGGMDVDDDMDGFSSFGGGGMPRSRGSGRPKRSMEEPTPSEVLKPLPISLEDIYTGTTKKMKISRRLAAGGSEDKVLEVVVKPGYKAGTKIKYKAAGNEETLADGRVRSQDIHFVIEEKPHPSFKREGDDLIYSMKIPLVDALCGPKDPALARRSLTTLDGRTLTVSLPFPDPSKGGAPLTTGREVRVPKEGFPITRANAGKAKGDLIVRIDVQFPPRVTPQQATALRSALAA